MTGEKDGPEDEGAEEEEERRVSRRLRDLKTAVEAVWIVVKTVAQLVEMLQ